MDKRMSVAYKIMLCTIPIMMIGCALLLMGSDGVAIFVCIMGLIVCGVSLCIAPSPMSIYINSTLDTVKRLNNTNKLE